MKKKANRATGGQKARQKAYAVRADGSRQLLDARSIIVDLGVGEVELDLEIVYPVLRERLRLRVDGLLTVGPGDASSVCVGVRRWKKPSRGRAVQS